MLGVARAMPLTTCMVVRPATRSRARPSPAMTGEKTTEDDDLADEVRLSVHGRSPLLHATGGTLPRHSEKSCSREESVSVAGRDLHWWPCLGVRTWVDARPRREDAIASYDELLDRGPPHGHQTEHACRLSLGPSGAP